MSCSNFLLIIGKLRQRDVWLSRRTLWWTGQSILYFLLWATLIKLPEPPSTALDASWKMVISYAAAHQLQFGQDLAFTYGPMGYLLSYAYVGQLFVVNWLWQIIGNLVIAAGFWRFGSLLSLKRQVLYYAYLFFFASMSPDAMLMNFIAILSFMLVRYEFQRTAWLVLVGVTYAIFSLMKFTNLFLCFFIIIIIFNYYFFSAKKREAAILGGAFLGAILLCWVCHGQAVSALPSFFLSGIDVSLGYAGAMAEYEAPLIFWLGLSGLAAAVAYAFLYFSSEEDYFKAGTVVSILAAVIFINWKHGFTRADGHVLAHFNLILMIACTCPALTQDSGRRLGAKASTLILMAIVSMGGMFLFSPSLITGAPQAWYARVRASLSVIVNLDANQHELDEIWQNTAERVGLKNISSYVAQERVTHLGDDQGFSLLSGLNFVPMPSVQTYSAYTPFLNRLDANFLRSAQGPHYVIQRYRALAPRLPPLEDSLAQKLLYQTYYYILEEGELMLWERPVASEVIVPGPERLLFNRQISFDEIIMVPPSQDRPIWAEIRIQPTWLGRIRQIVYKPPHVVFNVEYTDGNRETYRFVPAMGVAGFILSPFFRDGKDIIAYQAGSLPRLVKQFSLHQEPGEERYWQPQAAIELRSIAPFQRASAGLSVGTPHRFRMTNQAPVQLEALFPPTDIYEHGQHLLHMHAPSRMEFIVPSGFKVVRAHFGIMPNAYRGSNKTDGVEFTIEWLAPDGQTHKLYDRYLNPLQIEVDRGEQTLLVEAPHVNGGRLIFRTLPGPAGSPDSDWSYWTDIDIR